MSDATTLAARVAILTGAVAKSNDLDRRFRDDYIAAAMRREARALAAQWGIDPKIIEGLVRE